MIFAWNSFMFLQFIAGFSFNYRFYYSVLTGHPASFHTYWVVATYRRLCLTRLHLWLIATLYICLLRWKITFHLKDFIMCSFSSAWPNPILASTMLLANFWYDCLPSLSCQTYELPLFLYAIASESKLESSDSLHLLVSFHNWQQILFSKHRAGFWVLTSSLVEVWWAAIPLPVAPSSPLSHSTSPALPSTTLFDITICVNHSLELAYASHRLNLDIKPLWW